MLLLRHRTRKIVFRMFALLYLIAALWLILFAHGYRLQFSPLRLSATGSIFATFIPDSAVLLIEDSAQQSSSPARVRTLFPGLHAVRISADGYTPYERTVRVAPHETTFITDIFLIRDAKPRVVATSTVPITPDAARESPNIERESANDLSIESHPQLGTRILQRGVAISRDLGVGSWRIAVHDDRWITLARHDTDTIQLRRRATPDVVFTTLPGSRVISSRYKNDTSLIVVSSFELWRVSAETGAASLLYRVSKPITDVHTVPETPLVVVAHDDELVALRTNDYQTIPTVVAQGTQLEQISITPDGLAVRYTVHEDALVVTYERVLY